jgi:hypothetical protein
VERLAGWLYQYSKATLPIRLFIFPDGAVNEVVSAVLLDAAIKLPAEEPLLRCDDGLYVLPLLQEIVLFALGHGKHVD